MSVIGARLMYLAISSNRIQSALLPESKRQQDGNEEGSLLFTDLTYHMRLLYQTTDVEDIFKTVQETVAERQERRKPNTALSYTLPLEEGYLGEATVAFEFVSFTARL